MSGFAWRRELERVSQCQHKKGTSRSVHFCLRFRQHDIHLWRRTQSIEKCLLELSISVIFFFARCFQSQLQTFAASGAFRFVIKSSVFLSSSLKAGSSKVIAHSSSGVPSSF